MATEQSVGVRPTSVDDELFPFESHFVELDGNVVHHVDEGSGPIPGVLTGVIPGALPGVARRILSTQQ